ncbi:unnamed protein product [Clonostachys rosea]|uniref:CsbD-like domain-containing protein n=1 Tax=Bionectria ochroleuca TaxID=29856 RepID=A0ABY6TNS5_BIOOC|nr:unnamed protein product [Clonostachys rosea]
MSDNTNTQPSTLKSLADSTIGAVQSTIGSLTGNTQDQAKGEAREKKADVEYDASHATAKVPGAAISGSGAVTRDNSDRTNGSWNQTVGAAKETVGGLIGNESLKTAGRQQNLEGQQQEAKGQLSDLGSGISDRAYGTVGSAVSGLTGDKKGQAHFEQLRAEGKTQQRGVEHDILKKAEAEDKYRENV